jgi:hypothetical protein
VDGVLQEAKAISVMALISRVFMIKNGEWGMEKREWRMENGEWRMD